MNKKITLLLLLGVSLLFSSVANATDYFTAEIKAEADKNYGVGTVATMISGSLTAPDNLATFQISIDVTPTTGKAIYSGTTGGLTTTQAWGLGSDGRASNLEKLFYGSSDDWAVLSNAQVVNFVANGSSLTAADVKGLVFDSLLIINAQSANKDAVAIIVGGVTYNLGTLATQSYAVELYGSASCSIGTGTSINPTLNKWSVENVYVTYSFATSGITQTKNALKYNVSPNPSNGIFQIDLDQVANGTYSVYSINGTKLHSGVASGSFQLDLTNLDSGIYLIDIKTETNSGVYKLIKK